MQTIFALSTKTQSFNICIIHKNKAKLKSARVPLSPFLFSEILPVYLSTPENVFRFFQLAEQVTLEHKMRQFTNIVKGIL